MTSQTNNMKYYEMDIMKYYEMDNGLLKCCPAVYSSQCLLYKLTQELMSAAKQRDGASISGMGWNSRFVNHAHHETPYKEGVIRIGDVR